MGRVNAMWRDSRQRTRQGLYPDKKGQTAGKPPHHIFTVIGISLLHAATAALGANGSASGVGAGETTAPDETSGYPVSIVKSVTWTPGGDKVPIDVYNIGDEIEYTVQVANTSPSRLDRLVIFDALPILQLHYLARTATRDGSPVPDDDPGLSTPFPLDPPGLTISLAPFEVTTLKYRCRIIGSGTLVNFAGCFDPADAGANTLAASSIVAYAPVRIGPGSITAGAAGVATEMVFTVTLPAVTPTDITLAFATRDGTATAGSDYLPTNGILTVPAGASSATLVVQVAGNPSAEPDETFRVILSEVSGFGVVLDGETTGTIRGTATPDTDGDGLPDAWELQYGPDIDRMSRDTDTDGDRFTDVNEFLAGTDPTNANSRLAFCSSPAVGMSAVGTVTVGWSSESNRFYRLERVASLDADAIPVVVRASIPATPPVNTATDTPPAGTGPWFYRISLEP